MTASELFKAGKLLEAIDAQVQEVKKAPGDANKRLFLFEMLAFSGDLERAARQIEAIKYDEIEMDAAVANYRQLLDSERARRRVLREGVKPKYLTEPPAHIQKRVDAVQALRGKQPAEAARLLEEANALPPISGSLNGVAFQTIRDCDDLFGGVLEVMAHGEYYWVPLDQVEAVAMNAPKFPRDLLWIPARLEMRDDAAGNVFLPALYPNSHEHADGQIQLGRATDWQAAESGPTLGVGQRLYLRDDDAIGLLEWRTLQMGEAAS